MATEPRALEPARHNERPHMLCPALPDKQIVNNDFKNSVWFAYRLYVCMSGSGLGGDMIKLGTQKVVNDV